MSDTKNYTSAPNPRKAEILRRVADGENVPSVARDVGLSRERVYKICRANGVAYLGNLSAVQIAKIERNVQRNSAAHERRVESEKRRRIIADHAAELRANGLSWEQIGAALMMVPAAANRLALKYRPEVRERVAHARLRRAAA